MFERLSDEARSALQRGHAEGRALGAAQVTSGHYLLGLVCEGLGVGANVLETFAISAAVIRDRLPGGPARSAPTGPAAISREAKDALRAADKFSDGGEIDSGHILLGLVMSPDRTAAQIVRKLGVEPPAISEELTRQRGSAG
jgi:ATP-dependent Clp protease ATP-binding subunit ClpA